MSEIVNEKTHCNLCYRKFSEENPYHLEKAQYGTLRVCEKCRKRPRFDEQEDYLKDINLEG